MACRECNGMAGGEVFGGITEKLLAIREKRRKRYSKLIKSPSWTNDELEEIGYKLRRKIEAWQLAKECVEGQIAWNPLELKNAIDCST